MAIINTIPKSQHKGFELLNLISEKEFKDTVDGLLASKLTASVSKLAEAISKVKTLPLDQTEKILYSSGGLMQFVDEKNTREQLVDEVDSILKKEIKDFKDKGEETFKERLLTLLKTEQLYYASKSMRLKGESNNVFLSSRIISDIRPIFSLNVNEAPKASVIIHNLHIHFSSSDEGAHRDIYFALDSDDIKDLEDLIKRAKEKEGSMKTIFGKSQVYNLD